MTGVEAAGFVLGVLPLMISAAEHYEDIFRPFQRYRKFAPELERYQQKLGTQKTIFRNECRLLLATLTNRQTAKDMLREGKHPSWEDPDLNERFSRQLGDSGAACKHIINVMRDKLEEIEKKDRKLWIGDTTVNSSKASNPWILSPKMMYDSDIELQQGSIGDKAWRSRIGKKLKFSLSESQLEDTLKDLRNLNQDFRTLAAQTTMLDDACQVSTSSHDLLPRTDKAVQDCRLVRKASAQLHQALERACQIHEEHSAHFRLESQLVNTEREGFPLIRFNMAFAHCSTGRPTAPEPAWIVVDSTFDEPVTEPPQKSRAKAQQEAQDQLNEVCKTLKRENSTSSGSSVKRFKAKSVRFDTTASAKHRSSMTTTTTLITSFLSDPTLPDFCVQHDFCKQLQNCGPKTPVNKYIGYFEKSGPYKHLVYFAPPITACTSRQSFSLTQIIQTMSSHPNADQFLQYERLRLARRLASAVLQFHATPMLKDSWHSDDVVFFGTDVSSTALTSPHLNVQVGKSNSKHHPLKSSAGNAVATTLDAYPFVLNPYLFNLGVILIELACQAPLSTIQEKGGLQELARVDSSHESTYSDIAKAGRVSKSLGSSLGLGYAKVVRKCLRCDFGEGTTDLNDPSLQAVFYRDVVCELERLERAFASLQLGI